MCLASSDSTQWAVVAVVITIIQNLLIIFECLKKFLYCVFFFQIETEDSLKVLASVKKNVANPDDLDFMLKTVGVPLPQDVIQRALKNVAPRGEYLMYF